MQRAVWRSVVKRASGVSHETRRLGASALSPGLARAVRTVHALAAGGVTPELVERDYCHNQRFT